MIFDKTKLLAIVSCLRRVRGVGESGLHGVRCFPVNFKICATPITLTKSAYAVHVKS